MPHLALLFWSQGSLGTSDRPRLHPHHSDPVPPPPLSRISCKQQGGSWEAGHFLPRDDLAMTSACLPSGPPSALAVAHRPTPIKHSVPEIGSAPSKTIRRHRPSTSSSTSHWAGIRLSQQFYTQSRNRCGSRQTGIKLFPLAFSTDGDQDGMIIMKNT